MNATRLRCRFVALSLLSFAIAAPQTESFAADAPTRRFRNRRVNREEWEFVPDGVIQEQGFFVPNPARGKFHTCAESEARQTYFVRIEVPDHTTRPMRSKLWVCFEAFLRSA